jgi:hypothetical protein
MKTLQTPSGKPLSQECADWQYIDACLRADTTVWEIFEKFTPKGVMREEIIGDLTRELDAHLEELVTSSDSYVPGSVQDLAPSFIRTLFQKIAAKTPAVCDKLEWNLSLSRTLIAATVKGGRTPSAQRDIRTLHPSEFQEQKHNHNGRDHTTFPIASVRVPSKISS